MAQEAFGMQKIRAPACPSWHDDGVGTPESTLDREPGAGRPGSALDPERVDASDSAPVHGRGRHV